MSNRKAESRKHSTRKVRAAVGVVPRKTARPDFRLVAAAAVFGAIVSLALLLMLLDEPELSRQDANSRGSGGVSVVEKAPAPRREAGKPEQEPAPAPEPQPVPRGPEPSSASDFRSRPTVTATVTNSETGSGRIRVRRPQSQPRRPPPLSPHTRAQVWRYTIAGSRHSQLVSRHSMATTWSSSASGRAAA